MRGAELKWERKTELYRKWRTRKKIKKTEAMIPLQKQKLYFFFLFFLAAEGPAPAAVGASPGCRVFNLGIMLATYLNSAAPESNKQYPSQVAIPHYCPKNLRTG